MQQCIKILLFLILNECVRIRCLTTPNNCTSDSLPHMQNQKLLFRVCGSVHLQIFNKTTNQMHN
jgi:hypothetical protein